VKLVLSKPSRPADDCTMDAPVDKTVRLSEGETEILMRALVEAAEQQSRAKPGDTQFITRPAEASPNPPAVNTDQIQQSNFIL
jgi:hypothetical protein